MSSYLLTNHDICSDTKTTSSSSPLLFQRCLEAAASFACRWLTPFVVPAAEEPHSMDIGDMCQNVPALCSQSLPRHEYSIPNRASALCDTKLRAQAFRAGRFSRAYRKAPCPYLHVWTPLPPYWKLIQSLQRGILWRIMSLETLMRTQHGTTLLLLNHFSLPIHLLYRISTYPVLLSCSLFKLFHIPKISIGSIGESVSTVPARHNLSQTPCKGTCATPT